MYDGFSDTGKHSAVRITKEFLKLAFAGGHREASCLCSRCENRRMLSEYEMFAHLARAVGHFVVHQHGEVEPVVADDSVGNDDVDQMDDMVADIRRGHDLESEVLLLVVQNFNRLLMASAEKAHDGTNVIVFILWDSNQSTASRFSATTIL
jgi:hypothetical protein